MYDDANEAADAGQENGEQGGGREMLEPRAFGLGLVIGAIVGASAAILLAPDSGTRTRRKLRRKARGLYSRGGALVEDLREEAERRARQLRKAGRQSLRDGMRRGRDYADDAVDYARSARRRFGR